MDYKTNNVNVGNCEERIKGTYALQMALYQLAVARATDANPENVKAMVFCTVPGIEVDMTADKAALAGVEDKVRAVLDAIEGGEFDAPATVAREEHICAGCPFRELTKCGETRWEYDPKEREGEPEPEELETSDDGTYEEGI